VFGFALIPPPRGDDYHRHRSRHAAGGAGEKKVQEVPTVAATEVVDEAREENGEKGCGISMY
jgi:hypothetical protein